MKRETEPLNLRNAFPDEPESCHEALVQAARSVREDEPVKKVTFRAVLIAALIIAAMMAVAVAANNAGLVDWFRSDYGADLPSSAQEILSATEKSTLEAGPMVFAVNELLCDGKIAYLTAEACLKEEGSALVYPGSGDPYDRIGQVLASKLNHPGIDEKTTYLEAAQLLHRPLYCVDAWLEVDNGWLIECEMADGKTLESGSTLLVRMLYFNERYAGEELPVKVCVQVNELDCTTLDFKPESRQLAAEERSIPIHGVVAQKHYQPQETAVFGEQYTLTGVTARQTCAGIYVYLQMQTDEMTTLKALNEYPGEWSLLTADGQRYPVGMNLTAELLDAEGNPFPIEVPPQEIELKAFQYMRMITAEELPERLLVSDGKISVMVE